MRLVIAHSFGAPAADATPEARDRASQAFGDAKRDLQVKVSDIQRAQGALEMVGGQVAREKRDQALEGLRRAERDERDVEVEYGAWKLLVSKLHEAERTEGAHLGEALSVPVSTRFGQLTNGRYGKLFLEPSLKAQGVDVAGAIRAVSRFSVGTQEQLATLLRLTIAEHLGSTLVLDDQLTQTDPERTSWFRRVLREHAARAQIVVLTCRPQDYLEPSQLPADGADSIERAAGLVRAVSLAAVIERGSVTRREI